MIPQSDSNDIWLDDLFDVTNHVYSETKPHDMHSIKLTFWCKKYSLSLMQNIISPTKSINEWCAAIIKTEVYNEKKSNY